MLHSNLPMRRYLVAAWLLGCVGGVAELPGAAVDAPPGSAVDVGPTPDGGLVGGTLDVAWMHGAADCAANADPEVQVHAYNATTFILRQNKCRTFEAPFIYVLVGTTTALVLDTGDLTTTTLRTTIAPLVGGKPIVVAHSHAHGDHVRGDATFAGQPNTTVIGTSRAAVAAAFGIATWPTDPGSLELGGRTLDVLAIPGHEATHVAIYDRQTGLLLSGDALYPGMLFINDWATYRTSMHRLALFAAAHPIAHVLGAHVEMTSTPKQAYPYGSTYQPAEHVLQLTAAHVAALDAALAQLGATPQRRVLDDFIIDPQ